MRRFGKNGKKVIARKVFLFFGKIPTGMNRSIEFFPEFPGFFLTNGIALSVCSLERNAGKVYDYFLF